MDKDSPDRADAAVRDLTAKWSATRRVGNYRVSTTEIGGLRLTHHRPVRESSAWSISDKDGRPLATGSGNQQCAVRAARKLLVQP